MEKLTDRKVIIDLLKLLYESDGVSDLVKSYIRLAYNGLQQIEMQEEIDRIEGQKHWRHDR